MIDVDSATGRLKDMGMVVGAILLFAALWIYNSTHFGPRSGVYYAGGRYPWLPDHIGFVDSLLSVSEIVVWGLMIFAFVGLAAKKVRTSW